MLKRVYVEITNICNLRCDFCPGTRREGRFLSAEELRRIARRLRGHTRYLYFHVMGEPLLHHDVEVEVFHMPPQFFGQEAELLRCHEPLRPSGAGAEAAPQVAGVGDLHIGPFQHGLTPPPGGP